MDDFQIAAVPTIGKVLLAFFIVIMSVVMMNLLIAVMSHTHDVNQDVCVRMRVRVCRLLCDMYVFYYIALSGCRSGLSYQLS